MSLKVSGSSHGPQPETFLIEKFYLKVGKKHVEKDFYHFRSNRASCDGVFDMGIISDIFLSRLTLFTPKNNVKVKNVCKFSETEESRNFMNRLRVGFFHFGAKFEKR
jgi:hypothetical protein